MGEEYEPGITQGIPELLRWYDLHHRSLPWREMQDDPYAVWISEIMLQQTQVRTVIPYFIQWMKRFPSIASLASARMEDVLASWSGLGYYARARNAHRAAQIILSQYGGEFPADRDEIIRLPGIGEYTRGAILSIAFNLPEPLVDANVHRVISRLERLPDSIATSSSGKAIWESAKRWMDAGRCFPEFSPRKWNQALMELGALICTPSDPDCSHCPLSLACEAFADGNPTQWPISRERVKIVRTKHCSLVLKKNDRFLLLQRPPAGLWGGLWEFPRAECEEGESPMDCATRLARDWFGIDPLQSEEFVKVVHYVIHFRITLHAFLVPVSQESFVNRHGTPSEWLLPAEICRKPLSSPQKKLVASLFPEEDAINRLSLAE